MACISRPALLRPQGDTRTVDHQPWMETLGEPMPDDQHAAARSAIDVIMLCGECHGHHHRKVRVA